MAKLAGKIGIDLKLINCINDFFCAILSFWDMIDFVFFPLGLSRNLKKYIHTYIYSVTLDHTCFRIEDPSRNRLASTAYLAKPRYA